MGKAMKPGEKVETVETAEKPVETGKTFFKSAILKSVRYSNRRDALSFLLNDDESYTLEQVDKILDDYMKGQVN